MKNYLIIFFFLALVANAQHQVTVPIFGLNSPTNLTFTPDGRYLITLKQGIIKQYDANAASLGVFYDLKDSTISDGDRGLHGICIDPNYNSNKYLYVYYNHLNPITNTQSIRVVRLKDVSNAGTDPLVILDIPVSNSISGEHAWGSIQFSPSDGKLYISIGDIGIYQNSQLLTNPFGKFLRINSDGTIPSDNPFYDDGNPNAGNDDRIWSYGHRNPYDFDFAPNGSLYSSENGNGSDFDEVNLISKGKNYGWKNCEGTFVFNSSTPCQNSFPNYEEPIYFFNYLPTPALAGVLYYTANEFSQISNRLLVSSYNNGDIYAFDYNEQSNSLENFTGFVSIANTVSLTQGSDGCVYAVTAGYISKICPQPLGINKSEEALCFVKSSPNPFSETTEISYRLKKSGHIKVVLLDFAGRVKTELFNGEKVEGEHKLSLNAEQLNEGIYFCSIQLSGEQVSTIKLQVVR